MLDNLGNEHHVKAVGIKKIISFSDNVNMSRLKSVFLKVPPEVWDRHTISVDVLIGLDHQALQLAVGLARSSCDHSNLRLSQSKWVLAE